MAVSPRLAFVALSFAVLVSSGCSSTQQRAGTIAAGGAAAGGTAAALTHGKKNSGAISAGAAVAGAGATALLLGPDEEVYQGGYRDGYEMGQSEAIKRQYWMQQGMQRWGASNQTGVVTNYYTVPGPQTRADGQTLVPHEVTISVVEPK